MAQECELLSEGGFFKKYQKTQNLACKGYIQQYCREPQIDQCKRKEWRMKHGIPPSIDMLPSGKMFVED